MSNDKQSSNHIVDANKKVSSVEWYSNEIGKITALALSGKMTGLEWKYLQAKALEKAKEMHEGEMKQVLKDYFAWHKSKGFVSHKKEDIEEFINEIYNHETK